MADLFKDTDTDKWVETPTDTWRGADHLLSVASSVMDLHSVSLSLESQIILKVETLGAELLNGGDFEAGGTGGDFDGGNEIDNGTSDIFDPAGAPAAWINTNVNDGNGDKVEATATVQARSVALKMTKTLVEYVGTSSPGGEITLEPGKLYKATFYTRGDGAVGGKYGIWDATNGAWIVYESTLVTGVVYTLMTKHFTAPADCIAANINFRIYDAGTVYFDSASIKKVTSVSDSYYALLSVKPNLFSFITLIPDDNVLDLLSESEALISFITLYPNDNVFDLLFEAAQPISAIKMLSRDSVMDVVSAQTDIIIDYQLLGDGSVFGLYSWEKALISPTYLIALNMFSAKDMTTIFESK